jgi:hypothetical protein
MEKETISTNAKQKRQNEAAHDETSVSKSGNTQGLSRLQQRQDGICGKDSLYDPGSLHMPLIFNEDKMVDEDTKDANEGTSCQ